jgi:hypothetical protein
MTGTSPSWITLRVLRDADRTLVVNKAQRLGTT